MAPKSLVRSGVLRSHPDYLRGILVENSNHRSFARWGHCHAAEAGPDYVSVAVALACGKLHAIRGICCSRRFCPKALPFQMTLN